jgi:hypothetical protein
MAITNEQLLEFVRRNPIGVACGVICLGLGATYYFRSGLTPAAEAELADKETNSFRFEKNIENAGGPGSPELKQHLETLTAANKQIEGRLVRTQYSVHYGYFEKIAADTGAKRITLSQSTVVSAAARAVPKGGFVPVSFSFVVQGTYGQILDVLHRIENGQHFARVTNASVSKGTGTAPDILTLSLNLDLLGLQQ